MRNINSVKALKDWQDHNENEDEDKPEFFRLVLFWYGEPQAERPEF